MYHIILATAIVQNDKNKECLNEILINNKFNITEQEINKLKSAFNKVYILEDNFGLNKIDDILGNEKYNNIFVNNETELTMQYILNSRLLQNGEIVYIEDGLGCYEPFDDSVKIGIGYSDAKHYSEVLNMDIEDINTLGTHSKIKKRYFLYPDLITEKLKDGKENISIDISSIRIGIDFLYRHYYYEIDLNFDKVILIALEHSEYFILSDKCSLDEYIKLICEIIDKAQKMNIKVYLKYHPRESNKYLDDKVKKNKKISFICKNIPVEALYKARNLYLIAMRSTALITFSKISYSGNIICLDKIFNKEEDYSKSIFNKLNIYLPNNTQDIIKKIH